MATASRGPGERAEPGIEAAPAVAWLPGGFSAPEPGPDARDGGGGWGTEPDLDEQTRELLSKPADSAAALELIRERVLVRSSTLTDDLSFLKLSADEIRLVKEQILSPAIEVRERDLRRTRLEGFGLAFATLGVLIGTLFAFFHGGSNHSVVTIFGVGLGVLITAVSGLTQLHRAFVDWHVAVVAQKMAAKAYSRQAAEPKDQ